MKGHHYDFRELKNHTTSPVPRARGGRTQMRAAGNPDVFKEAEGEEAYAEGDLRAPATRGKRRAARPRSRNERKTLGSMAGVTPKHRADRRARGIQKRADSGYTGPYSGATGYVPVVAMPTAHWSGPAVPQTPDYTPQLINAGIGMLGKKDDNLKAEEGIISGIKMPGGGTLGDATNDALQDFRMDTSGCRPRAVARCASAAVMFAGRKISRQNAVGGSNGGKDGSNEHRSRQTDRFLGAAH